MQTPFGGSLMQPLGLFHRRDRVLILLQRLRIHAADPAREPHGRFRPLDRRPRLRRHTCEPRAIDEHLPANGRPSPRRLHDHRRDLSILHYDGRMFQHLPVTHMYSGIGDDGGTGLLRSRVNCFLRLHGCENAKRKYIKLNFFHCCDFSCCPIQLHQLPADHGCAYGRSSFASPGNWVLPG